MVMETTVFFATLNANQTDVTLTNYDNKTELTPIGSEKINVHELVFHMDGKGYVVIYVNKTRLGRVSYYTLPDNRNPLELGLELEPGDKLTFKATDQSGATNYVEVLVKFERA